MFFLLWAALLSPVRGSSADTGASVEHCNYNGFCITLNEGEITAEAGLCVVIPCSFSTGSGFTTEHMVWYKCEPNRRCGDSDVIFHTNKNNKKVQPQFKGRVSLLQTDVSQNNCSIIINDLTVSDSGSYQLRVNGFQYNWSVGFRNDGFTFSTRPTVSVRDLIQKPTVMIPPLTEGQQTTLTCTAPGHCSGSDPTITWRWKGTEANSHITGNITAQNHRSNLTFNPLAELHGTSVTCKVSFTGDTTTEETVTLNVTYLADLADQPGPCAVLPWVVAAVSLIVNVIFIVCLVFLWNTRKKVKPNQEDRTYMSLRKNNLSPEYDVIGQPLN